MRLWQGALRRRGRIPSWSLGSRAEPGLGGRDGKGPLCPFNGSILNSSGQSLGEMMGQLVRADGVFAPRHVHTQAHTLARAQPSRPVFSASPFCSRLTWSDERWGFPRMVAGERKVVRCVSIPLVLSLKARGFSACPNRASWLFFLEWDQSFSGFRAL